MYKNMEWLVIVLALLIMAKVAFSGEGIGSIKTLSGDVKIERAGQLMPAQAGLAVFQSDRIITGADGAVGLLFADDTRISAGPRSTLELSSFKYDKASQEGNLDVAMQKGTLSVISGKLVEKRPGALKVRTPAAILAVRGTEFSVKVEDPVGHEAQP